MKSPEFQELTEQEIKDIDGLFPQYLFYTTHPNGDREYQCTRCRSTTVQPRIRRTSAPEDRKLMNTRHGDVSRCPICGAVATVKSLGKSKSRKNLWHREKVVVIHAINPKRVEARCYYAERNYEYSPIPQTELIEKSRYLLTPGSAVRFSAAYYNEDFYSTNKIGEPFPNTAIFYGTDSGYSVFGLKNLKDTFLKYNQLKSFISLDAQHCAGFVYYEPIMTYLSYFAIYPQLEILQKLGHYDVVRALVNEGKKSFPYVNWKAKSIADFFKMDKQGYKSFKENGGTLTLLHVAHKLRSGKEQLDFIKAKEHLDYFGSEYNFDSFADSLKNYGISFSNGYKYVSQKKRKYSEYTDYLRMANSLGYDLKVRNVAFPKNLKKAHDNAATAERAILEERKAAENKRKELAARKYLKKYEKQYAFTDGNYTIIVPHTVSEIVEEGKAMKHCVGGYAGRHMAGTLAILFLRMADTPDKSLYTIEMHGKHLTQVQGYNNRTPLTPEAKTFFDMWLSWVKDGSHRDKEGKPILKTASAAKVS